jgi:hypothetical protein
MPDRWTLREWSRYALAFAVVSLLGAEFLERANKNARLRAEDALASHQWNSHGEGDTDE